MCRAYVAPQAGFPTECRLALTALIQRRLVVDMHVTSQGPDARVGFTANAADAVAVSVVARSVFNQFRARQVLLSTPLTRVALALVVWHMLVLMVQHDVRPCPEALVAHTADKWLLAGVS